MGEYIEKTQLLEKLKHRVSTDDDSKFATGFIKGTNEVLDIIEEWIASVPAADVAPVVHGKWLKAPYKYLVGTCSVCGCEPLMPSFRATPYNYCPNCGAKMDEEAANT